MNEYFIAVNGDDNNPGTIDQPWKTLDKANKVLKPGDMVTLKDGIYQGIIEPVSSGESWQKPVVYRSENRHGAILTAGEDSRYIMNLSGKHYITVDGFKMLPVRGGFGYIKDCSHITLQNCDMEHSTMVYCPLEFIDSDHNRMLYNNLTRVMQRTSDSKIHGDGCHFINSSYNVIEGNAFSKIGHSPLRVWSTTPHKANYNVIRGNCFHNGWGRNFEMFNLDRSLFEGNIITDAFNGAMSADSDGKVFLTDGIFRHCLVYDNWDTPFASNSYIDLPTTGDVPLELKNSRIYNNTFVNNPSYLWSFGGSASVVPIRSNTFMNNIFARNDFLGDFVTLVMVRSGIAEDNLFHHNLFYGEKPDQAVLRIRENRYTAGELNDKMPEQAGNNLDGDPQFKSMADRCYIPGESGSAINTGRFLALVNGSGSGNVIPVTDARCFYDGFGIEGEQGDMVIIGSPGKPARVVKADIENNELTVDRKLKWKKDDPVSLPYAGTAPDIGAFQAGNTGVLKVIPCVSPYQAGINTSFTFAANISGDKGRVKMEWDLGDSSVSNERSPGHTYRKEGDYVVRLKCTDASGAVARGILILRVEKPKVSGEAFMKTGFEEDEFEEWGHLWDRGPVRGRNSYYPEARNDGQGQCMCVSTEASNTTLATNVKMRIWDIDKYPYVIFSYRIPKGVPVGVWVDTWPSENHPARICLGGSASNSAGDQPILHLVKLTDDNQWHDAEIDVRKVREIIPDIKHFKVFGFSTRAKTQTGQKFWFDDFSVSP